VTVGDDVPAPFGGSSADQSVAGLLVANLATGTGTGTGLILFPRAAALPSVWVGSVPAALTLDDAAALLGAVRPFSLLPEHGEGWFGRPGLSGHRLGQGAAGLAAGPAEEPAAGPAAGHDWSPLFRPARSEHGGHWARVEAADATAGLELVTEIEAVRGGAARARHTLTNRGRRPYVVDSLEVVFPLPGRVGEVLDFTGRQTAERIPQRHRIGDGLWLREGRRGHTGHDSATMVVAGVPGFAFGRGEAYGVRVAWLTGRSMRPSGPPGCVRSRTTCVSAACSSGSGSSPKWSTRIPISTARIQTGSSPPASDGHRRNGISWCST